MRSREVWIHAIDLGNGGKFDDLPREIIDQLLPDLLAVWRRKREINPTVNIVLAPTDRAVRLRLAEDEPDDLVVTGTAVDLVAWGTGRFPGRARTVDGKLAPPAPPWL
jgi:maleylpyruvate isomerase